jgi:integrase
MSTKQGGLSVKRIERIRTPGRYADGHGLYLQVTNEHNKSWLLRYQRNNVEHWLGLGPLHTFTLDEARERARKARQLLADGIDPLHAKRSERERMRVEEAQREAEAGRRKTFAECAEAFLIKHADGWKNPKHRSQWKNTLATYAFPVLGKMFVADIDTPHIRAVLERDKLWTTKRETARRVLGRMERVLNFAKASGYRSGDNPASWKGHLKDLMPANGKPVEHLAALPYTDIPAFMLALRQRDSISAKALEFTILTAARTGETIGATWDEIDLKHRIWTIPANRMKAGKEHKVPLTERVLDILKQLPRTTDNPHLFAGSKQGEGLTNMTMNKGLQRMRWGTDITVHGFRSTFMDWAHDRSTFNKVVIDMALAHAVGDKVEAAYRRGDLFNKRKQLMQAWANYCSSTPVATTDNVVTMRA